MCKVLVFSKNRPMQLHAYLESLIINCYPPDIMSQQISVLYYNDYPFNYDDVIKAFPLVNWIHEEDFNSQVRDWIKNCEDPFMMFGCDDVIFIHPFGFGMIEWMLKNNQDIFGISLRLGKNIKGFPEDAVKYDYCYCWNWQAFEIDDFHYPWELDCTIYRTSDIRNMINKYQKPFINPNYFEEFVVFDWDYYIKRPKLACLEGYSKAIVLTINRVQNTHPNYYDDNCPNLEELNDMYQQGYRIEYHHLPENDVIHVGSDYLKFYWGKRINEKK